MYTFAPSLVKTKKNMAERYQVRKFEPVNNLCCRFLEASVDGKFLFQEFLGKLKDNRKDTKKLMAIYAYMDSFGPDNLLPKTKFRQIEGVKCKDLYEFKKNDIRIYVIFRKPRVFVILGAYKGTQKQDFKNIDRLFGDFEI